jgi:2-succinyl-6-hydroxy-2,4-cyclohexadiene-1-carboxylate synthase
MFVKIDHITYHILKEKEGQPLICLHGFSEEQSTWEGVKLEGVCQIRIDLIGHGKSDKPKRLKYYKTKYMLMHLKKIIVEELGIKKFSIMGYSMGGRLALAFALEYPQYVNALILESASYGEKGFLNRRKRQKQDKQLANLIRKEGIEWFEQYWSSLPIFNTQMNLNSKIKSKIKSRRLANIPYALANTLEGSGQGSFPNLKGKIKELKKPVLYICGQWDKKYKEIGKEFQYLNSNIQYVIISEAGHNVHIEQAEKFQKEVNLFLKKKGEKR